MSTEGGAVQAAPRDYPWRMAPTWWLRRPHYFWYVVREFTALPLAIWLLWFLYDISQTRLFHPLAFAIFSIVCLPFALYHSYTFLKLAGVIIRIKIFDRPLPSQLIVAVMFGTWGLATLVIGFLLIWLAS